jgi:hypothetical protein
MIAVARLGSVSPEIREAFLPVLDRAEAPPAPNRRPTCQRQRAARLAAGRLYRTAAAPIPRRHRTRTAPQRLYGFSWTRNREIARKFAEPPPGPMNCVIRLLRPGWCSKRLPSRRRCCCFATTRIITTSGRSSLTRTSLGGCGSQAGADGALVVMASLSAVILVYLMLRSRLLLAIVGMAILAALAGNRRDRRWA